MRSRRRAPLLPVLVLLVVISGLPVAASVAPSAGSPASAPLLVPLDLADANTRLSHEVYGYLPYWELNDGTDTYLRYELLTTIAFFGVPIRDNGSLGVSHKGYAAYLSDAATTIIERAHAAGVRTDVTVTSFGADHNARFFGDAAAQARAIEQIAALVRLRGADGVNLDVELLAGTYFDAYGAFAGALRSALQVDNPSATVTVATNANTSGARMAAAAVAHAVDRAFVMGYSYRNGSSDPVGSNGPLERADDGLSMTGTLDHYTRFGVPFDRLLFGLPYYGYSWATQTADLGSLRQRTATHGSGSVFFPRSLPAAARGSTIAYDPLEATAWFARWDLARETWVQAYFEDAHSLLTKYRFAADRGLAGAGMWALGYDRGSPGYWEAIDAAYGIDTGPRPLAASVDANPVTSLDTQVSVSWEDGAQPATEMQLSNDELTWSEWQPIAASVPWRLADGPDGPRVVSVRLRDAAGVESWIVRAPAYVHVGPRLHLAHVEPASSTVPAVAVAVEWQDGATPTTGMRLSNDGVTWTDWLPPAASTPWTLVDGDDGPRPVSVQLQDAAGLVSEVAVLAARLDRAPLLGPVTVTPDPARATAVDVGMSWNAFGDTVTQARLSNDGHVWGDWTAAAPSVPWVLAAGLDGPRRVWVQLRDGANLRSKIRSGPVTLRAAPVVSEVTMTPDPAPAREVTVHLTWQPDGNPPTQVRLSNDGSTWGDWQPVAATLPWTLADGPPGERTVSVQLGDAVGNAGPIASHTVTLQAAPGPSASMSMPAQALRSQVGQDAIPVVLAWGAGDASADGVAFDFQGSTDGSAWTAIGASPTTETWRVRWLSPDHQYRFRVHALDGAGTPGPWVTRAVRVAAYTESSSAIRYAGSWSIRALSGARGRSVRTATTAGATARLTLSGRAVAWIAIVGPDRGRAEVRLDGGPPEIVDLYAAASSARRAVFTHAWPAAGSHTLEIRWLATPARRTIDVDGFTVLR